MMLPRLTKKNRPEAEVDEPTQEKPASKKRGRDKKAKADPAYKPKGQLRAVIGHVTVTQREVIAWFVQEPQSLSFRPDKEVEETIAAAATGLSDMIGRRTYWRVTTRPYAVRQFAEATHADADRAADPLPEWPAMLAREQEHMLGASLAEKWSYVGVRLATSRRFPRDPRREVAALSEVLGEVEDRVAAYGLEARPATDTDMEWLLRRSVGLGLPAPAVDASLTGDYDTDDLPELWEHARWGVEPWGRTIQVTGTSPSGDLVTRHVAVLTMSRMEGMDIPQDGGGGWMQRTDRLAFPVEWMGTVDLLPEEKVIGRLRHQMDIIKDQWLHYVEDHGMDPPESLKRQRAQALASEDEVAQGLGGLAARTEGWYRLAVWGDTEAEALANVRAVQKLYGRQVSWWHSWDQYRLGREFMAGEPLANTAARRRMSVTAFAAALPAATAEIGDKYGAVLGWTSGTSKRAVVWHPWRDMEVYERSGLLLCAGELGSGKTVASSGIVYRTVMWGVPWTVFDPSGRLGALCDLPEMQGRAQYVDLLRGRDGELGPYRVVVEPVREHFDDENDYQIAVEEAAAMRVNLCKDILTAVLPEQMRRTERSASVLTRAVARVGGAPSASAAMVLDELDLIARGEVERDLTQEYRITARDIHTELTTIAQTPKGRLIFPAAAPTETGSEGEPLLKVYSLHGLDLPDAGSMDHAEETSDQRMSVALFNLAAWLTQRAIYLGDKNARKGLFIDEGHLLQAISSGKSLIRKSATDSRKHNARIVLSSQNVTHFDIGDIGNLVGAALIGRTEDESAAAAALRVLGVKEDQSYMAVLGRLSQAPRRGGGRRKYREFIFSDGRGAVERMVFDLHAHPHVLAALDSTADPTKRANQQREAS